MHHLSTASQLCFTTLIVLCTSACTPSFLLWSSAENERQRAVSTDPVAVASIASVNGNTLTSGEIVPLAAGQDIRITAVNSQPGNGGHQVEGFAWRFLDPSADAACAPHCDRPSGSQVTLEAPSAMETGLYFLHQGAAVSGVDIPGIYRVELTIIDDTGARSAPSVLELDAQSADLVVRLLWDTNADLDLRVAPFERDACDNTPAGAASFANGQTDWGGTLLLDDTDGTGPEEVVAQHLAPGVYTVWIDGYEVPSASQATLTLWSGDALVESQSLLLSPGGVDTFTMTRIEAINLEWDGSTLVTDAVNVAHDDVEKCGS